MGKARGWGPRQQAPATWGQEWGIPEGSGQFPSPPHWLQHKLGPTTADGETEAGYPLLLSSQLSLPCVGCTRQQLDPAPRPPRHPTYAAVIPLPWGWRQGRAVSPGKAGGLCRLPGGGARRR